MRVFIMLKSVIKTCLFSLLTTGGCEDPSQLKRPDNDCYNQSGKFSHPVFTSLIGRGPSMLCCDWLDLDHRVATRASFAIKKQLKAP